MLTSMLASMRIGHGRERRSCAITRFTAGRNVPAAFRVDFHQLAPECAPTIVSQ